MKNFILPFFLLSLLFTGLVTGLIVAVDPYDTLGINVFNFETKAVASSRENKFYMLNNSDEKYEAFILGSSTAHRYKTSVVKSLTGYNTFNYAVQHTTPHDYLAIINHIRSKFSPKLVILQVSMNDLDKTYAQDKRLYTSPLKDYVEGQGSENTYISTDVFSNKLLTLDAIRDSLRVMFVNWFGKARHVYEKHGDYRNEKAPSGDIKLVQFSHQNWELDHKRLEILEKIQKLAEDEGFQLIVISAPIAPIHYNKLQSTDHMKQSFTEYKSQITNLFENLFDYTTPEMSAYNSVEYFLNSTHPSKKLSTIILKDIWSKL